MIFTKYHKDDKLKENHVIRACSTHGRHENCIHIFV